MTLAIPSGLPIAWTEDDSPYIGIDHSSPTLVVGGGPDLREITQTALAIWDEYLRPASRQVESTHEKFKRLVVRWRKATMFQSSAHQMATHPSYQEIIGIGRDAVPFLLQELERSPDHWFWALRSITGIDPVPPKVRGNVRAMADAWLEWGRVEGHIRQ